MARLGSLEERVAALEEPLRRKPPGPTPTEVQDDRFWVLHGLRGRFGEDNLLVFAGSVRPTGDEPYEWQQYAREEDLLGSDLGELAQVLAALGHRARLALLVAVLRGSGSSAELQELEGFGTSGQLYHHLRQLTAAGWLRSRGGGRYEIPPARIIPLLVALAASQR